MTSRQEGWVRVTRDAGSDGDWWYDREDHTAVRVPDCDVRPTGALPPEACGMVKMLSRGGFQGVYRPLGPFKTDGLGFVQEPGPDHVPLYRRIEGSDDDRE